MQEAILPNLDKARPYNLVASNPGLPCTCELKESGVRYFFLRKCGKGLGSRLTSISSKLLDEIRIMKPPYTCLGKWRMRLFLTEWGWQPIVPGPAPHQVLLS